VILRMKAVGANAIANPFRKLLAIHPGIDLPQVRRPFRQRDNPTPLTSPQL